MDAVQCRRVARGNGYSVAEAIEELREGQAEPDVHFLARWAAIWSPCRSEAHDFGQLIVRILVSRSVRSRPQPLPSFAPIVLYLSEYRRLAAGGPGGSGGG